MGTKRDPELVQVGAARVLATSPSAAARPSPSSCSMSCRPSRPPTTEEGRNAGREGSATILDRHHHHYPDNLSLLSPPLRELVFSRKGGGPMTADFRIVRVFFLHSQFLFALVSSKFCDMANSEGAD